MLRGFRGERIVQDDLVGIFIQYVPGVHDTKEGQPSILFARLSRVVAFSIQWTPVNKMVVFLASNAAI
jgi:hypothetical protein